MKPLCIDLYCGLGGFSEGFLAEGYECVGFDIERHDYGSGGYPGQLVLQDVLTLHGRQFRNADIIVASPPCQAYSYRAMPWNPLWKENSRLDDDGGPPVDHRVPAAIFNDLFRACFCIQREASEAAGHHIPMIVENVKGAQPWVGRAAWHYGSYFLWGDVPALMPASIPLRKLPKHISDSIRNGRSPAHWTNPAEHYFGGLKVPNFHEHEKTGKPGRSFQSAAVDGLKGGDWFKDGRQGQDACAEAIGRKGDGGGWFGDYQAQKATQDGIKQGGEWWHDPGSRTRRFSSRSAARKAASAQIAKIPLPLSTYLAQVFKPHREGICV